MAGGAAGILGTLRILVDADSAKAEKVIKGLGGKAQIAGAAIGAGIGLGAAKLLQYGDTWDAVGDTLRSKTGLMGDDFRVLEGVVKDVGANVSEDLAVVGDVVAQVQQRTGLLGPELAKSAESIIDLARLTGTEYGKAADNVSTIYEAWGVAAKDQIATNDLFLRAYQQTGTTLDTITTGLAKNGATFRQLGFSIEDSTVLLATLDKAGIEASTMMGSFRRAVSNLIKAGEDPKEAITGIFDAIKDAPDDIKAGQLAMETFGTKGAVMAQLIREGKLDVRALYDTIAGGADTVQGAADDTRDASEGFKELGNRITGLLGPVTETFAGMSEVMGNSMLLLPAIGGAMGKGIVKLAQSTAVRGAASRAGGIIGKGIALAIGPAMAVGNAVINAITGSDVWSKAGKIAGGKFGMAFKAAGIAGLGLLIAAELAELGEVRQANVEQAAKNTDAMNKLLEEMPTRAEAEAKLAALEGIPGSLEGVQGAVFAFSDFAKGNILGSAVDGLFGSNPAANLQEQTQALKDYIAKLPAEVAAAVPAGPSAELTAAVVAPIKASFTAATREVGRGFGNVRQALNKPIRFVSIAKRIENQNKMLPQVMKRLRGAIEAGDPAAVRYWDRARAKVQGNLARLKGTTAITMADVRKSYRETGVSVKGTWAEIQTTTTNKSEATQETAVDAAQDTKAGIDAVNLYGSGVSLTTELASGMRAGIPNVLAAGYEVAGAASRAMEAHSPPKEGPLKDIDKWGGSLVDTWLGGFGSREGDARRVGARLAGAVAPRAGFGGLSASGVGGPGRASCIHVGTLIADDRGIDQLQRRMNGRVRFKERAHRRYNEPS